jgi:hypothetical protein
MLTSQPINATDADVVVAGGGAAARECKETRGSHFREDYTEIVLQWALALMIRQSLNGSHMTTGRFTEVMQ